MNLTVIVPIYNEGGHLAEQLERLERVWKESLGPECEVLLVDDGSTDGSRERLEQAVLPPGWRVLHHARNRGYGAALKTGLRLARHPLVAIIDADGTYPAERLADLARMLDGAEEVAMVVGARSGAEARRAIPWIRRPAKWMLTRVAEHLAECPIPDLNSGLRVFRREVVLPYLPLTPNGFSFTTTITLALLTNGYEVRWEPVDYFPRRGRSKIRPLRDTLGFLQLILRTLLYFNPLKFFVPVSLALFLAGGGLLLARLLLPRPIGAVTTVVLFAAALQMLAIGILADLVDKRLR